MRTQIAYKFLIMPLVLLFSCSTLEQFTSKKKSNISVRMVANKGGITGNTGNTDMSMVADVKVPPGATVDAFTGATQPGFNAGVLRYLSWKSDL